MILTSLYRPKHHLSLRQGNDGKSTWIIVHPEILFLDFDAALANSGLLARGLAFPHIIRKAGAKYYNFDTKALREAFKQGGHGWMPPVPPDA